MKSFFDSLASIFASIFTLLVCGGPAWFSHVAIRAGLVPTWGYAFVAGLVAVGLVLAFAFGRKAMHGIAPSRQRRR